MSLNRRLRLTKELHYTAAASLATALWLRIQLSSTEICRARILVHGNESFTQKLTEAGGKLLSPRPWCTWYFPHLQYFSQSLSNYCDRMTLHHKFLCFVAPSFTLRYHELPTLYSTWRYQLQLTAPAPYSRLILERSTSTVPKLQCPPPHALASPPPEACLLINRKGKEKFMQQDRKKKHLASHCRSLAFHGMLTRELVLFLPWMWMILSWSGV